MKYFLYFFSLLLAAYGMLIAAYPKNEKRLFLAMAYLVPFWAWAIIFFSISVFLWYARWIASFSFLITLSSLSFFFLGLMMLFLPKRKISKNIEKWASFPENKKRITGGLLILLAFLLALAMI